MQSFGYPLICFMLLVVFQTLISLPSVKCKKEGMSNLEMIKLLFEIKNFPSKLIQKVREKPLIQLLGLANDIVEPFVTAAEVVLLFDDLKNKLEDKWKKEMENRPPIQINQYATVTEEPITAEPITIYPETQCCDDQVMDSFKLSEVRVPFNELEQNMYSKPNIKLKESLYNVYDDMKASASTSSNNPPMLFSTRSRQGMAPKVNQDEYEYIPREYFLKHNPEFAFYLVGDMPKNFAAVRRNPVRRVTNSKPIIYRLKH